MNMLNDLGYSGEVSSYPFMHCYRKEEATSFC